MKENFNWWKFTVYVIAILALLALGFFCGRKTIKQPEPDVIYLPGDTVKIEVLKPIPVKEEVDTANLIANCVKNGLFYELFPEKIILKDSIIYLPLTNEDTAKVFNDWATKRTYSEVIFDVDTIGRAELNAYVQYNRLMSYDCLFTPVIKQVSVVKKTPKYSPFLGAGITTHPSITVTAGYFYEENWGAMFMYQYDYILKKHNFGSTFLIKF